MSEMPATEGSRLRRLRLPLPCSVRCRIAAGFGLLILILAVVVASQMWLERTHVSLVVEMEEHAATAERLQAAKLEGATQLAQMELYILTGMESLVSGMPAAQDRMTDHLLQARAHTAARDSEEDTAVLEELLAGADTLFVEWQNVIALRRGGEEEKAKAALVSQLPLMARLGLDLDRLAAGQREDVAALQSRVNAAGDLAFWLLAVSGGLGAVLGLAVSIAITRSVLRPLSALQAAALAVAGGDLQARAQPKGPTELAQLGASLNRMTDSLVELNHSLEEKVGQRTQELAAANEALKESEEWLRQVTETIAEAFWLLDYKSDGTYEILYISPAYEQIWGRTCESLYGHPESWLEAIHPEDRERVLRAFGELPGGEYDVEYRVVRPDGSVRWVRDHGYSVRTEPGEASRVAGAAADITERKLAEEELRRSRERFQYLVASSPAVIYTCQPSGDYGATFVSDNVHDQLQYESREFTEDPGFWSDHVHPEDAPHVYGEMSHLFEKGQSTLEYRFLHKDGNYRWMHDEMKLVRDAEGDPVEIIGYWVDVTQRRQAGEELKRLNGQLEEDRIAIRELNRSLERKVRERTEELRRSNRELRKRHRQLVDARVQATTDSLTDLPNHRAFQQRIREEVFRTSLEDSQVGLIMLDIDGFKRVNDSLGHLVGDQILRDVAYALAAVVGEGDVYRYGGDEFAVVLPGAGSGEGLGIAERIRAAVEGRLKARGTPVTVSAGVASFPEVADSAEELIYGADAAMYWAKSAGKNRVGTWTQLKGQSTDSAPAWYRNDHSIKAPEAVAALMAALDARDRETSAHNERCSSYAARLAQEAGLSEENTSIVRLAALLHDIGKLAVPDRVLFKRGPLNEEEWGQMKKHPTAALHILRHVPAMADATPAILHHHEHYDGSGYPDGLAGNDIPIAARVLLVVDAFDAMTADRPYRKAMPAAAAIEELKRNSGSQFDPDLVEAFLRILNRDGVAQPRPPATRAGKKLAGAGAGNRRRTTG